MKKTILTLGLLCTLLNACAYKPIIDTNGRSGTFDKSKAENITNDIILCEELAKKNTNDLIREKLREGEVIGTSLPYGNCVLSYGKFKEYELVITINDNRVIKVEEF